MLDLSFIRAQFPALYAHTWDDKGTPWALLDNAGGSVLPRDVIDAARDYMSTYQFQVGAQYPASQAAQAAILAGRNAIAELMDCDGDEVVINGSTTLNVYLLADALCSQYSPGDVVVISEVDHEANRGAWKRLRARGIEIREWKLDPKSQTLQWEQLEPLMDHRVRLVAYTQCSNLIGAIHDIRSLNEKIHTYGAEVCVDGVAFAPHRALTPKAWGCDYYIWSAYKVYGPHLGVLYAPREKLLALSSRNHDFIAETDIPYKLQPGNVNHELGAAIVGTHAYLKRVAEHHELDANDWIGAVFQTIAEHESTISAPLLRWLDEHPRVHLLGPATADIAMRVPTIGFTVDGIPSECVAGELLNFGIAARYGSFYARAGATALGIDPDDGIVRLSFVHYNTAHEVARVLESLDQILKRGDVADRKPS